MYVCKYIRVLRIYCALMEEFDVVLVSSGQFFTLPDPIDFEYNITDDWTHM